MKNQLLSVLMIGLIVIGSFYILIAQRGSRMFNRAYGVFVLGAVGLVAIWLINHPQEAVNIQEQLVRKILSLTQLFL